MTVQMKAPSQVNLVTRNGNAYATDSYGFAQIQNADVVDLLNAGWQITPIRNNVAASVDPAVNNDSSQDYGVGSMWVNTTDGSIWDCFSAALGAAIWLARGAGSTLLARIVGANMNVTTDQAFTMLLGGTGKYRITKITAENASISLTTAVGGVYPTTSKGGTAIVANSQAYSALDGATKALDLTLAVDLVYAATVIPYLALTTAQGAAATADFNVYGDRFI